MVPAMQYTEKKAAEPIFNKEMIIVFLLCMFPPTYVRISLHNTFQICKEKFTYQ